MNSAPGSGGPTLPEQLCIQPENLHVAKEVAPWPSRGPVPPGRSLALMRVGPGGLRQRLYPDARQTPTPGLPGFEMAA